MAEAVVLVGTRKGLLIARSDGQRRRWDVDPMQFGNKEVSAVAVDARRSTPRILAGLSFGHFGTTVAYSDDLGRTWSEPEQAPIAFPESTGATLARVWQLHVPPESQPDVVYAGVEPHALFRSDDGGLSFSLVQGYWDIPDRTQWMPGGGGACLHTVLTRAEDPRWLMAVMSTGGAYRSEDGGATWVRANRGIQQAYAPEDQRFPEFNQCVHKVAFHPSRPDRLFAQNHFGVYRSENAGDSWTAIENGLPSNFGFPIVVHPDNPDMLFNFPLEADMNRIPPSGRCAVYRSMDAGESWHASAAGLPGDTYYSSVLRDAMSVDNGSPAGVYFGTRLGEVYASIDCGESWSAVASHLPDVLSVRAAVVS
ncbi:MAG TPA: exo-alpha-sialidase [Candidatus Dormibacteraeota bacterium]|nr:exo-alpha-sialidase [Candidatus Dormibacteraeota bacterium]